MTHYGFAIDTTACVGCHACAIMCKSENNVPDNIAWNRIMTKGGDNIDVPASTSEGLQMGYRPLMCQHCEEPACVRVCPVGATWRDPETGIVHQEYDKCIGCRMCIANCPYTGIRSFNWEAPAYSIDHATGSAEAPAHQKHTVEKCVMCSHRVAAGEEPACVGACFAKARIWGDLDDPASAISKALASRSYEQLLPEKGTKPSVYYLV